MSKITLTFEGTIKEIKGQMTEVMACMTDIKSDTPSFPSSEVKLGSAEYNRRIQEAFLRTKSMQSQLPAEEQTANYNIVLAELAEFNYRVLAYKGKATPVVKRLCLKKIAEVVARMGIEIDVDWFNTADNGEIEMFSQAWCSRTGNHKSYHDFSELASEMDNGSQGAPLYKGMTLKLQATRAVNLGFAINLHWLNSLDLETLGKLARNWASRVTPPTPEDLTCFLNNRMKGLTQGEQMENAEKETPATQPLMINLPEEYIAGKTEGCFWSKTEEGQVKYKILISYSLDEGETSLIFTSDGPGEDGLFVWTKDLD